jgi:L,D-transpeptidase ErfK/SrfK
MEESVLHMQQIINPSQLLNRLRPVVLVVLILSLNGCAALQGVQERYWPRQQQGKVEQKEAPQEKPIEIKEEPLVETIEKNEFPVVKGNDVVGQLAFIRLEKGDTLPDIARHFGLGLNVIMAANPGVDVWAPKEGERIMLPLRFILPGASRKGIVINLAAMRLFQFKGDVESQVVTTYPVGVGAPERPTPMGRMYVARKTTKPTWHVPASIAADHRKKGDVLPANVPPGPENPLGEYALYLSRDTYLIHGTNKPASIGLRATNGCIRLYPEDIKRLFESAPVKTPVSIINQPYLIGKSNGVVYMEVHAPMEGTTAAELEKAYVDLRNIEKETGLAIDWDKVKKITEEARGIPVPVLDLSQGNAAATTETIQVRHPDKLYGKPEIPELDTKAWYVSAANMHDEVDAVRLAAIVNHQGPPIPARVLAKSDSYSVIAGPFKSAGEAKAAAKRLSIDLELKGILVEPVETK